MLFDGMVPVLTHTPPSIPLRSISATFLPSLAEATAAFCPPGPEPMTTRSYSIIRITRIAAATIQRHAGGGLPMCLLEDFPPFAVDPTITLPAFPDLSVLTRCF